MSDDNIRVVKGQMVDGRYPNQTLIFLPSFAKAWELFESLMLNEKNEDLSKRFSKSGLAISTHKEKDVDGWHIEDRKRKVAACWQQITVGPSRQFVSRVESVSHVLMDLIARIDPSMRPVHTWDRTEIGPVFDAGLIASEDERPCFDAIRPTECFKKADGSAYRLVINTDTCASYDDSRNCLATMAMVRCLNYFGETELWIQQGWVGGNPKSGVTVFPIHKGQEITPALTWFWLASPYRDSVFSRVVNAALGRRNSGTSSQCIMENDIYMANAVGDGAMPLMNVDKIAQVIEQGGKLDEEQQKQMYEMAAWLAKQIRPVVYTDEFITKLDPVMSYDEFSKQGHE